MCLGLLYMHCVYACVCDFGEINNYVLLPILNVTVLFYSYNCSSLSNYMIKYGENPDKGRMLVVIQETKISDHIPVLYILQAN